MSARVVGTSDLPEGGVGYWVDDSDRPFPRIRHGWTRHPLTFTQAKRQLLDDVQSHIRHWQGIAAGVRDLRKGDVEIEEEDQ